MAGRILPAEQMVRARAAGLCADIAFSGKALLQGVGQSDLRNSLNYMECMLMT
jgi:hypothetical protein